MGSIRHSNAKLYTTKELNWTNEKINLLGIDIGNAQVVSNNYDSILDRVKNIVRTWKFRGLSLLGRVIMLNALAGSIFVDKMNVVPIFPEQLVDQINEVINGYLRKGAKPKIPLNVLDEGGLKLFDIRLKDMPLKVQWVAAYFYDVEIGSFSRCCCEEPTGGPHMEA